jgi:hypothetical protein
MLELADASHWTEATDWRFGISQLLTWMIQGSTVKRSTYVAGSGVAVTTGVISPNADEELASETGKNRGCKGDFPGGIHEE